MARRRSFIATRLSKMRGIDRSEKELLVSIGNIVDNAVNNRTPTNPRGAIQKAGRKDPRLPPVTNLRVQAGVRSVKIAWNPVDGSILENYAIKITNLGTGDTTDNISYTSSFVFKGESGDYKAEVKSVGRNSVASPVQTIFFTIPDSVMILEGAKNGNSTESPFVSEVVLTPSDYKVFAWTSFILNSFASPVQNNSPIVQLLYGDALNTATLIQSVTMFPESETATNLNDLDYGFILRPDDVTRTGNFETSHSVMFAPFDIPDGIANRSTRFWVNVTNRDAEADVISLSIVLWVGSGGRGELGETPVAVVNPRSIDQSGATDIYLSGIVTQTSGDFEDQFTISRWIKPFDLEEASGERNIFLLEPFAPIANQFNNKIGVVYDNGLLAHSIRANIYNSTGSVFPADEDIITMTVSRPSGAGGSSDIWTNGNNNWNFITVVWDRFETGVDRLKIYMNGVRMVSGGSVIVTSDGASVPDMERDLTVPLLGFNSNNLYMYFSGASGAFENSRARFNSSGVWNSALTAAEILTLYNGGAGANVDWRTDTGDYVSSANLSHYWLYGLDTTNNLTIAKDYGNSATLFNMNFSWDVNFLPVLVAFSAMTTSDVVTDAPV